MDSNHADEGRRESHPGRREGNCQVQDRFDPGHRQVGFETEYSVVRVQQGVSKGFWSG